MKEFLSKNARTIELISIGVLLLTVLFFVHTCKRTKDKFNGLDTPKIDNTAVNKTIDSLKQPLQNASQKLKILNNSVDNLSHDKLVQKSDSIAAKYK